MDNPALSMDNLKPSEAAKLLNVSYFTVKQWIYGGKIQSIKTPGGHHRIPRSEIERVTGGAPQAGEEPGRAGAEPAAESHHILVAEDTPDTLGFLDMYLRQWGYEVTATSNGLEAWEHVKNGATFDLYLLDYMLPDIAGTDLCRSIRERDPLTPVIFFSAVDTAEVKRAAFKAGAQDFLLKNTPEFQQKGLGPFGLLKERIDWWIRNPEFGQDDGGGNPDANG
jgi:excisionase family DNA binding protein